MDELNLRVTGMTCASCVASVESIVSNLEGIDSVRVNLPLEKATIRWSEGANEDLGAVRDAISKGCLLYTSPSPRDKRQSRMPSSA